MFPDAAQGAASGVDVHLRSGLEFGLFAKGGNRHTAVALDGDITDAGRLSGGHVELHVDLGVLFVDPRMVHNRGLVVAVLL